MASAAGKVTPVIAMAAIRPGLAARSRGYRDASPHEDLPCDSAGSQEVIADKQPARLIGCSAPLAADPRCLT